MLSMWLYDPFQFIELVATAPTVATHVSCPIRTNTSPTFAWDLKTIFLSFPGTRTYRIILDDTRTHLHARAHTHTRTYTHPRIPSMFVSSSYNPHELLTHTHTHTPTSTSFPKCLIGRYSMGGMGTHTYIHDFPTIRFGP